ncbi:MAG: AFG1 family ATPase [Alphaproteobacteria bacterium]|nr:AFG1 family ATPase [Alphaproteobacteria bacterium]
MRFLEHFRAAVANGDLKPDPVQEEAARKFDEVGQRIAAWPSGPFGLGRAAPRGLYLWGDVGRGKSMLMDMFFAAAAVPGKRRVHFNAFMADIHAKLHHARRGAHDPIAVVARATIRDVRLLCFDEFQVADVADAMILGRLFEQFLARGCVIVATSNVAPDNLYEGGLNRQLFLPFIALIKQRMEVVSVNGEVDYRRGYHGEGYLTGPDAAAAFEAAWQAQTSDSVPDERVLTVLGRRLRVPHAAGRAARFAFHDLCEKPLAAADYLAIAEAFDIVFLEGVPALKPAARDPARRLTLLIDTLYDARVALVCSAAVPPEHLYPSGDGTDSFRRTVSRLLEMRSPAYTARAQS